MLINESGLVRAVKSAYKSGGYTVSNNGDTMAIYTENWFVKCKRAMLPRKVLATIVEHMGMIPDNGTPVSIAKDMAYNMDCLEAMRKMPDHCFDLAVVDPPYGIGENGKKAASRSHVAVAQAYKPFAGEDRDAPQVTVVEIVLLGDAVDQLRTLEPESVNTCVTSPPYYNLRDYGAPGQIGMEATPEEYIESLVQVFREVRRVLRQDGTLWVNIGDSYATRSGPQPPTNTRNSTGHTEKRPPSGYKYKDLIGVPWLLAFALRADGWYLRQDIIWSKTRCMPESVRDRCTKSHEYIFLLTKNKKYYFDHVAIQEKANEKYAARYKSQFMTGEKELLGQGRPSGQRNTAGCKVFTGKRNKRSVWTICTSHFSGAHFAVYPEKLVEPCILAGCPAGGTVLDPFTGSGTTGVVAKRLGRNFVGAEINPEYWAMATERIASTQPEAEQIALFEMG